MVLSHFKLQILWQAYKWYMRITYFRKKSPKYAQKRSSKKHGHRTSKFNSIQAAQAAAFILEQSSEKASASVAIISAEQKVQYNQ